MAEVRDEAIRLVQLAQLLVDVDLLLGLLWADAAQREGRCFEHAVARRILADRPAGGPRHAPLDANLARADRLLQSGRRLGFDVLVQLFARLKALRYNRRGGSSGGHASFLQKG